LWDPQVDGEVVGSILLVVRDAGLMISFFSKHIITIGLEIMNVTVQWWMHISDLDIITIDSSAGEHPTGKVLGFYTRSPVILARRFSLVFPYYIYNYINKPFPVSTHALFAIVVPTRVVVTAVIFPESSMLTLPSVEIWAIFPWDHAVSPHATALHLTAFPPDK
jgi:hypothetical protein